MPIAILSATHRPHSYTRRIALYVARRLEAKDYAYQFIDFQALPREFLFSDLFGERSERFLPMIEALAQCSSWIWVVPEYNGSFPGVVKVFIDALPREVFRGKRAGLIGVSDGRFGNLRGLEHLMGILHYCGMEVAPFRAHLMRIQSHWNEEEGRPASVLEEEIETFLERFLPAPITA